MTPEEKAKAYDEAIDKVAHFIKKHIGLGCMIHPNSSEAKELFNIFPQLKENENEEIRKDCIKYLDWEYQHCILDEDKMKIEKCVAWLEKQGEKDKKEITNFEVIPGLYKCVHRMFDGTPDGKLLFEVGNVYKCLSKHDRAEFEVSYGHSVYLEDPVVCKHFIPFENQDEQKPDDKVEPKFKPGDWITNDICIIKITSVDDRYYWHDNDCVGGDIESLDKEYHLWTIKDAKNGDILMANAPFIFNGNLEGGIGCPGAHCAINTLGEFQIPTSPRHWTGHTTTPATKEQRDLLFAKMEEAGYEWDANKKELKGIEHNLSPKFRIGDFVKNTNFHGEPIYEIVYIDKECYICEYRGKENMGDKAVMHFSFDNPYLRIVQKPAWSEEDEKFLNQTIEEVDYALNHKDMFYIGASPIIAWLKSLKQRLGGEK